VLSLLLLLGVGEAPQQQMVAVLLLLLAAPIKSATVHQAIGISDRLTFSPAGPDRGGGAGSEEAGGTPEGTDATTETQATKVGPAGAAGLTSLWSRAC
jgi:hypothetical protein